jgi:predicted transcriptional regulator
MSRNRSRLNIAHDLLAVATVKVRKTKIMSEANLNYIQVNSYLKAFIEGGLIANNDSYYLTTQKGREFLRLYSNYVKRCDRIREEAREAVQDRQRLERMCSNCAGDAALAAARKGVLVDTQTT